MKKSPSESSKISDFQPVVLNNPGIEVELCTFYEQILKDLYKSSGLNFLEIRKSLKNMRSYKNPDVENHDTVSFDETADRLAYIFAYCNIHSVVMYDRFSGMLKANPSMLKRIISMKKIRLCILGGGPGFEAITVCKILSDVLLSYGDVKRLPCQVHLTIIDIFAGWKKDAKLIFNSALQNLCSSKILEINFNFIVADLTSDFSGDVSEAIKKAHIVTMFKFLSDVNDASYSESDIPKMIHNVIESMSFKSCLFFLDNAGGNVFHRTDRMIDKLHCTSRIYGPCLHNCHVLSMDSAQKFSDAFKHIFRYISCTNRTTVCCSAWLKIRHIIEVDEINYISKTASCYNTSNAPVEEVKVKDKVPKIKIKKVLQYPAKFRELYCDSTETNEVETPKVEIED